MRFMILLMMLFSASIAVVPTTSVQAAGARIDGNGAP